MSMVGGGTGNGFLFKEDKAMERVVKGCVWL